MSQNKIITSVWVEMGHHALALEAPLLLWDGSLACGAMEERDGGSLERQRVSRHSHGKHNDRERSVLRVTPTLLFIAFF